MASIVKIVKEQLPKRVKICTQPQREVESMASMPLLRPSSEREEARD